MDLKLGRTVHSPLFNYWNLRLAACSDLNRTRDPVCTELQQYPAGHHGYRDNNGRW